MYIEIAIATPAITLVYYPSFSLVYQLGHHLGNYFSTILAGVSVVAIKNQAQDTTCSWSQQDLTPCRGGPLRLNNTICYDPLQQQLQLHHSSKINT